MIEQREIEGNIVYACCTSGQKLDVTIEIDLLSEPRKPEPGDFTDECRVVTRDDLTVDQQDRLDRALGAYRQRRHLWTVQRQMIQTMGMRPVRLTFVEASE